MNKFQHTKEWWNNEGKRGLITALCQIPLIILSIQLLYNYTTSIVGFMGLWGVLQLGRMSEREKLRPSNKTHFSIRVQALTYAFCFGCIYGALQLGLYLNTL